jgi:autotransporter-associated beta strand protein
MKTSAPVIHQRHPWIRAIGFRSCGVLLFLLLGLGLSLAPAANILTNPGFEEGQTGWGDVVRLGSAVVVTDPAIAHTGNNYISNYNAAGWSSANQGDLSGGYSTGVSLPVSDTKYYQLSAWVKVPGAATNPQPITLRYRFYPSGNRVDIGTQTISTENWTLLQSPWIQPAAGDALMAYWEVHSLNNGILFYADDCALLEADPFVFNGRVVDGTGTGVDGATVAASSGAYASTTATTAGGGYYSLSATPVSGTWTVKAITPGFKGSVSLAAAATPIAVPNIVLSVDSDYDPDLVFSAYSSALAGTGAAWATACPASGVLTPIGTPGVHSYGGVQWEQNAYSTGDGYRFTAAHGVSIPCEGASIVAVVKPTRTPDSWWSSIVNCFYNSLMLNVRNYDGLVQVVINNIWYDGPVLAEGQVAVLSAVIQPDATIKVYVNGVETALTAPVGSFTEITAGGTGSFAYGQDIDVGRNDPDGWSTYNGNIGDVYLYKIALNATKRAALEASLMNKFITNATLSYTITASTGANGSISPSGATTVVQGFNRTYTMAANAGFVVSSVLVDGTSVGAVTSYTFTNVSTAHTIAASFVAMPPQTITASAQANGTISPSGAVSVMAGADQTFAMLPNNGYAVSNVVVDGISQGEIGSYTFHFVTAPHTISVTFRALDMNIPRADQLLFSVVGNALPGNGTTNPWPTYVPLGRTLAVLGSPTSVLGIDGAGTNIWENNVYANADGYRWPTVYTAPIPCSGVSIAAVVAPVYIGVGGEARGEVVDLFYSELFLAVSHSAANEGEVIVDWRGYHVANTGYVIPDRTPTLLCLVVQPNGDMTLYANTAKVWTQATGVNYTSLQQSGLTGNAKTICVGRNDYDGWSTFSGNIGDVFLYTTALSNADRKQLEAVAMSKYRIPLPPTYEWAGPNNGNWSVAGNWNTSLPEAGLTAVFSHTNTAGATIQLDTPVTVGSLEFNNLVANTTIASALGNSLTLDVGKVTLEAGSHSISAAIAAPNGLSASGPASATLNLNGTVTAGTGGRWANKPVVGLNVALNGTASWTASGFGYVAIGSSGGGTLTINDHATFDCSGAWDLFVTWDTGETGKVVQNGGTVITPPVGTAWSNNNGPGVQLGGAGDPVTAEYDLNGGTLITPNVYNVNMVGPVVSPPTGSALFRFNGGVLKATQSDNFTDPVVVSEGTTNLMGNLSHAYVGNGGAKIDTATFTCGINQALEHDPSASAIDGGLSKLGLGTLTLYRASTYTGPTKVQAGVLALAIKSAVGGGALDISTGAKLELYYIGTASVSQLTFNGGAPEPSGTYGATGSGAAHIDDSHFAGTGTVTVSIPTPVLPPSGFTMPGGKPTFQIPNTVVGCQYTLVYKNHLSDPTWTPLSGTGTAPGNGGTINLSDPTSSLPADRFYRLQVQ